MTPGENYPGFVAGKGNTRGLADKGNTRGLAEKETSGVLANCLAQQWHAACVTLAAVRDLALADADRGGRRRFSQVC